MSLVNSIKKLCRSKNTSLPKLERELGFSNGSIYKWDENAPSITKVLQVAQYFGVSVDSLTEENSSSKQLA